MHTLRESQLEQRARLGKTPQGKALLELLEKYPTKRALAKAIGSSDEYVTRCSRMGKISMAGAILIDQLGVMKKEQLRLRNGKLTLKTSWLTLLFVRLRLRSV